MFSPSWRSSASRSSPAIASASRGLGRAMTWHSPAFSLVKRTAGLSVMKNTSVSSFGRPAQ